MPETVTVIGEPGVQRMLDQYDPQARQNLERRAVRAGANVVKRQMAFQADGPGHPGSFRRVRVRISSSMRSGGVPHAIVRPSSPLFNIFEPGAASHVIAPRDSGVYLKGRGTKRAAVRETHSGMLAGPMGGGSWTTEGRKRPADFFSRGPVTHPGLRARPILPAVMASAGRAAQDAMAAVIFGQDRGAALGSGS